MLANLWLASGITPTAGQPRFAMQLFNEMALKQGIKLV